LHLTSFYIKFDSEEKRIFLIIYYNHSHTGRFYKQLIFPDKKNRKILLFGDGGLI